MQKTICLSFDIEDWFQVENLREKFPPEIWDKCESRVVKNTIKILDLLDEYNVKATFFILGWIAERFPDLVKEIHSRGHEIASHGYGHIINYQLSRKEIFKDIRKSKEILENIIAQEIIGYRAPSFSITEDVIDVLKRLDFKYDSSYHPFSKNKRYGQIDTNKKGFFYIREGLLEIPMSVWKSKSFELSIAGGGYFRLYPYILFKSLALSYLKKNDFLIMYFHPWEFDPEQPRIKDIKFSYRFRHYIGLKKTYNKLSKFLEISIKNGFTFRRLDDSIKNGGIYEKIIG
ncbi:MAG: DUF3473 domain-containing protein [Thermosipho sp. (in: Bacteria)]|nr:DUF3473 domain-containing protein [Thermosipho sp. (in: thermotogales)]